MNRFPRVFLRIVLISLQNITRLHPYNPLKRTHLVQRPHEVFQLTKTESFASHGLDRVLNGSYRTSGRQPEGYEYPSHALLSLLGNRFSCPCAVSSTLEGFRICGGMGTFGESENTASLVTSLREMLPSITQAGIQVPFRNTHKQGSNASSGSFCCHFL